MSDHKVTQEDLVNNPDLKDELKTGDQIPEEKDNSAEEVEEVKELTKLHATLGEPEDDELAQKPEPQKQEREPWPVTAPKLE